LKRIFLLFLYLNIYTLFFFSINAQELSLEIETENTANKDVINALEIPNSFRDYITLKKELDTVSNKLNKLGFIENELLLLSKKNDSSYHALFKLGNQFTQVNVFYASEDVSEEELLTISKTVTANYFVIPFVEVEQTLQNLNNILIKKGNAFASVSLSEIIPKDNNTLTAKLKLNKGQKRTIDKIIIKGYEKFPVSFIKYFARIRKDKTFNQEKLLEQSKNLSSLGFVTSTKPPEILFKKDSTTVYLYLKKKNNNSFDGILGFSTDEEKQKLVFNGYLNLILSNNLNFGEKIILNYKGDGNQQQSFRVRTEFPYLFKTPMGANFELNIFKRDSSFLTVNKQALAYYQLGRSSKVYIGYKDYESNVLLDNQIETNNLTDYNSSFLLLGIDYLVPQNEPLFPFKTNFSLFSEIGKRESATGTIQQFKIIFEGDYIFSLNKRNSIYIKNSTSTLVSDSYFTNELIRFGGINSIRGFDENSIDATLFTILNTEYRYLLNTTTYIHSIIDIGYFENKAALINEQLVSFGFGFAFLSKAGLFKLNIANGTTKSLPFKFSNTKIHISIRSNF